MSFESWLLKQYSRDNYWSAYLTLGCYALKWIDRLLVAQLIHFGSVLLLLRQVFQGAHVLWVRFDPEYAYARHSLPFFGSRVMLQKQLDARTSRRRLDSRVFVFSLDMLLF
jgi:hypothetical protein